MEMDERELHLFQRIFQKRAAIVNSGSVHVIQCEDRLVAAFGCDTLLPSMVCVLSSFNLFFCLDCKCIKYRLFHKLMLEKTNHIIEWLSPNALCLLKLQMLSGTVLIICHCLLHTVSNWLKSFSSLSYSKIFVEKHTLTLSRDLKTSAKKCPWTENFYFFRSLERIRTQWSSLLSCFT